MNIKLRNLLFLLCLISPWTNVIAQPDNTFNKAYLLYNNSAYQECINFLIPILEDGDMPALNKFKYKLLLGNCYAHGGSQSLANAHFSELIDDKNIDQGLKAVALFNLSNLHRLNEIKQNPDLLVDRFYLTNESTRQDTINLRYVKDGIKALRMAHESSLVTTRNLTDLLISYDLPLLLKSQYMDDLLAISGLEITDDWKFFVYLNIANCYAKDPKYARAGTKDDTNTTVAESYYINALEQANQFNGADSPQYVKALIDRGTFHDFNHRVFWQKANDSFYQSDISEDKKAELMHKADEESLKALTNYQKAVVGSLKDFNDTLFYRIPNVYSLSTASVRSNLNTFEGFRLAYLLKINLFNALTFHYYKEEWNWDFNIEHFRIRSTGLMSVEDGFDYTLSGYAYNLFGYYDKFLEIYAESLPLPDDKYTLIKTTYKDRVMAVDAALNYQDNISGFVKGVAKIGTKNRSVIKVKSFVKRSPVLDAFVFAEKTKALLLLKEINSPQAAVNNSTGSQVVPSIASISQLQSKLGPETALVSYLISPYNFYIFIVTHEGLEVRYRGKLNSVEINRQIKFLRNGMVYKMNDIYAYNAWELGKILLPKLDKEITKLIIIPDGFLNTLPFEVLFDDKVKDNELDNVSAYPFWLKKYDISYAFSATLFLKHLGKSTQKPAASFLGYAPVFADNDDGAKVNEVNRGVIASFDQLDSVPSRSILNGRYITPIPNTELEVNYLQKIFSEKGLNAKVITRHKATESSFKSENKSNYSIIHFATHGFVNSQQPELSGILFIGDTLTQEDGILYSEEILKLKLDVDLVTLSACETGLGKVIEGEGVLGLSRSLTIAGANNLLVSYWKVSDSSTSELMKYFYTEVLEKEEDYAEALRNAKMKLINSNEYAQPYYWSPFVLIKS